MEVGFRLAWPSVVSNPGDGGECSEDSVLSAGAGHRREHSLPDSVWRGPTTSGACPRPAAALNRVVGGGVQGGGIQPTWQRILACAGLLYLYPHLNLPHLRTASSLLTHWVCSVHFSQLERCVVFCFLLHLPVCNAYLAFPSRVCAFLFPGLVSGKRRRRKRSSQSRSPIQRKRERTMPPVRARTGTEPGPSQAPTNSPVPS